VTRRRMLIQDDWSGQGHVTRPRWPLERTSAGPHPHHPSISKSVVSIVSSLTGGVSTISERQHEGGRQLPGAEHHAPSQRTARSLSHPAPAGTVSNHLRHSTHPAVEAVRSTVAAAVETERKFLVDDLSAVHGVTPNRLGQAYLLVADDCEARIRISATGAIVTLKQGGPTLSRLEEEFIVTDRDIAKAIFDACPTRVIKDRYSLALAVDSFWEVDVFLGENEGLILAEIELPSLPARISIPEWCRLEVTGDPRFYNAELAANPLSTWDQSTRDSYEL
jgi:adenylate cyclase